MGRWTTILILAAAQFVMLLDSSVMNVAISRIVADLDTTVSGFQLVITSYTLVMASFMLVGAKVGDIIGRDRAFAIGLAIYALGSLTTALSPNLAVLLVGWSLIEGLGAMLVIPAIAALIAGGYQGRDRALAYGIIGGISAVAVAAGPLVGGWITTVSTWRLVFVLEVGIVAVILLAKRRMPPSAPPDRAPRLDLVGAALSASGLALIVFGILQSGRWGWLGAKGGPDIGGVTITPLGLSVVPFLILGGLGLLWGFGLWQGRMERSGRDPLLDLRLLSIPQLRAGISTLFVQQLVLMGTFFILPVYLQLVVGLDAFQTGLRLLPLSLLMFLAALLGPQAAARWSPRVVARTGLVAIAVGAGIVLATMDVTLDATGFALGLAVLGTGAGLLASQLGNVIMSSVSPSRTSEAGGLQGTALNLGSSTGTALIGAILLAGLTAGFVERVAGSDAITPELQAQVLERVEQEGLETLPVALVPGLLGSLGVPPDQAAVITAAYAEAELAGLRQALGAVAAFALVGIWFTRHLPASSTSPSRSAGPVAGSTT